MAADVVGYSRMMGADEAGTHAALKALRAEVVDPMIADHHGRIVKLMGDGALIEFASVVDALTCAVVLQRGMAGRNAEVPADKRIAFRIGINLGDIIVDGDDIYGNGVNVAARLESLAEPGGICLSGRVLDQVEKNVDVGFAFLGPQTVKNIEKPVNAYNVLLDPADAGKVVGAPKAKEPGRPWLIAAAVALVVASGAAGLWYHQSRPDFEPPAVAKMPRPLPGKPSIAVLPFTNIGGDPEQEYFADGMTDDLITDLSKVSGLHVIASNSVFTYKGKPVKVQDVAADLGVRYVLEGSVRRAGGRMRINAQLVDAAGGGHLWAERYDRQAEDVFAVQDEVTRAIVSALSVRLTETDRAELERPRGTRNLEAYDALLRGRERLGRVSRKNVEQAKALFEKAIALDPNYARAYTNLGFLYWHEWRLWGLDRDRNLAKAMELGHKAVELDDRAAGAHLLVALVHQYRGEHDEAEAEGRKVLALDPTQAETLGNLGRFLKASGRFEEAIAVLEKAMRIDPHHPPDWIGWLGQAHFRLGRYDEAIRILEAGVAEHPDLLPLHLYLAQSYATSGRAEQAKAHVAEVLRLNPDFTIGAYEAYNRVSEVPRNIEIDVSAMREAGFPE
jgi:TolB-like protein/Flp pilus assembly protein TadD